MSTFLDFVAWVVLVVLFVATAVLMSMFLPVMLFFVAVGLLVGWSFCRLFWRD